jgi:PAS domain S-box-containing protein
MEREGAATIAISERAERFGKLLALSHEPTFAWRLDGAIDFWNAGAERLYGFSSAEAIGRVSHVLLQTKFPIPFVELRANLLKNGYWSGELRHVCKDEREVIVDSRMQVFGDEIVLEANRDISELKALASVQARLIKDLAATTAKFEGIFNQSGLFAGIMDLQGFLREANDLSVDWCGYAREQVLGRPFWQTPWWRGSEAVQARIRLATSQAASGAVFREELPYWLADGSERLVDFAMHPIRDETRKVAFLHPTGIDITDRRRYETALRDSEQRLRWLASIVQSSDDAVVSKNLDGIITSWNRGAERIFGYSAEEATGQPITMIIPKDRHDEERQILARIGRGERIDHFETIRQTKQRELLDISLTVSPVKDAEGVIVGASKIARDITGQKRAQERIATLAREAEHRSKNLLASVHATVMLSRADTPEGLKQAIEGRIQALANVHSLFVETRWTGAELLPIATQELAPFEVAGATRVRIDGPQVMLPPNAAQAIAVTLHELATNAAKYGALSAAAGRIDLTWQCDDPDGRLTVRWQETGGPPVQAPAHRGFGGRVIEQMANQLRGTAQFDWRREGLVCEIIVQTRE